METHERGGRQDDRGPDQAAAAQEARTHAGDHAICRPESGRPVSGPIEDQPLVRDEHRFGDDRPRAAGAGQSGDRRHQMEEQDGQVTHAPILPTS
jgi:hypothetical protein